MMGNHYLLNQAQGWAAVCISKNACTSLKKAILATKKIELSSKLEIHRAIGFDEDSEHLLPVSKGKPDGLLTFAVWRDPVDRFLSAFRHFSLDRNEGRLRDWPQTLEGWIACAESELEKPILEQDEHIRRQSDYYSHGDVDVIVDIRNLSEWFRGRGWGQLPRENASSQAEIHSPTDLQVQKIRTLYSSDYTECRPSWPLSDEKPRVEGMWVGDTLPPLAELCMRSFLDQGFHFRLWSYRHFKGIPGEVENEDAGSILTSDKVFRHSSGSYSPFGDWFRYELLSKLGGLWTDMDVACLQPFQMGPDPWFACEENGVASLGLVRFSQGHPLTHWLARLSEDPTIPVPWDQQADLERKERLRNEFRCPKQLRMNVPWGITGPAEFTKAVNHFSLQRFAAPSRSVYPVPWGVWRHSFNGTFSLQEPRFKDSLGIHLWGEMLRREPDAMQNLSPTSIVAKLLERHQSKLSTDVSTDISERSHGRILVGVCSCRRYPEKRQAVRDTWMTNPAEGIDCVFFVGGASPLHNEPDTVVLEVDDSYDALPEKVLSFFRHALTHSDFDWLFKCDDDTYLSLPRLGQLTTLGGDLVGNPMLDTRGSPSGGAGYLLSRQIVQALVEDTELPRRGAEDVIIGEGAVRLGAIAVSSEKLRWNAVPAPAPDNDLITAHWCSPARLKSIHSAMTKSPSRVIQATSPHWNDSLTFYDSGSFRRTGSGCDGTWRLIDDTRIALDWFDWPGELLLLDSEGRGRVTLPAKPARQPHVERWISLWHTFGSHGLPHLGQFQSMNPGVPVHVLHGERHEKEADRKHAWRNCDRVLRDWWHQTGKFLEFDRVAILEWDVLFRQTLNHVFPPGDFVGRKIKLPGSQPDWPWFREIACLPASARDSACGIAPLAILAVSRRCLSAIMEHPLSNEMFDADIFCELRFATLAKLSGFELVQCPDSLPNVEWHEVPPGNTSGVWHAVKLPQLESVPI